MQTRFPCVTRQIKSLSGYRGNTRDSEDIFFIIFHFQRMDEWKKIFNTNIAKTFHHGSFYQSGYWRIGEIRGNIIIFEVWTHTLCHSRTVIQSKIFIFNAISKSKTVLKRELKIKFRYNIVAVIRGKVGYTKSIYSIFLFSCVNQKRMNIFRFGYGMISAKYPSSMPKSGVCRHTSQKYIYLKGNTESSTIMM